DDRTLILQPAFAELISRKADLCISILVRFPVARFPTWVSVRSFYEPTCKEGTAEVSQEHHRDRQEVQGIHGRGTSRDEGAPPRAEGGAHGQGGRGKRRAREDRRDAGTGSRHGQAVPCNHQSQRASPLAETLVRDARVCQRRQGRLLLPKLA